MIAGSFDVLEKTMPLHSLDRIGITVTGAGIVGVVGIIIPAETTRP